MNITDLEYSHALINSINCLHLSPFRSQVAIVSENSIVFTFSNRKAFVNFFNQMSLHSCISWEKSYFTLPEM